VQSGQVGVDLFAYPHKGLDKGIADLVAKEPSDLDHRRDRRRLGGRDVGDAEDDQRGDAKGEPDCPDDLRRQEILPRPVVGEAGIEPAGIGDQRKAYRH